MHDGASTGGLVVSRTLRNFRGFEITDEATNYFDKYFGR